MIRLRATPEGRRSTMQGDVLSRLDGPTPRSRVYGRVVAIERDAPHIDLQRPLMRVLARAAALRSRGTWVAGTGSGGLSASQKACPFLTDIWPRSYT
jgi:hypothetical protein